MLDTILICVQEPHQGRAIVFSHASLEDLFASFTRHYAQHEGIEFDTLIERASLIRCNPQAVLGACRDLLAHDMQSAYILTAAEAIGIIRADGRHSIALAAELDLWDLYADTRWAHPQTGEVQTKADWVDDSLDWDGDIEAQLNTLIAVTMDEQGEWVES
jgi:hypothetical protein